MKPPAPSFSKILYATISGGGGWALAAIAPIITTPILLEHLGASRYGTWMMLSSIAGFVALSDLGIANGVTSRLARLKPDDPARRVLVTNIYFILATTSLVVLACIVSGVYLIRIALPSMINSETGTAAIVVLVPAVLNVPFGFVSRLLYADARGIQASMIPGVAALMAVPVAIIGAHQDLEPDVLLLLFLSAPPLTYLAFTLIYFARASIIPVVSDWSRDVSLEILRAGVRFLPLSLLVVVCNRLDYFILANVRSVEELVPFAIADKVVGILSAMVTVLSATLWPIFAREIKQQNIAWIKQTITKLHLITVLAYTVIIAVFLSKYNEVVELWLGQSVQTTYPTIVFLLLSSMVTALASPYFAIANSAGAVRPQIGAYVALLCVGLPIKLVAGNLFGSAGVAAGGFVSWAAIMLPWIVVIAISNIRVRQQ